MPRGRRPTPLPPETPELFRARDARRLGLNPARPRARDLDASVHGIRSRERIDTLRRRVAAFMLRMPDDAFVSHATAALLHGAPLPPRIESDPAIDIAMPAPHRGPDAAGIRGHRLTIDPTHIIRLHGVRVSDPARTWLDLGGVLGLAELVAVGDFLVHHRAPATGRMELAARLARRPAHLSRGRLSRALALLDERAESAPESLLRVALALAGLPAPAVNHEIAHDRARLRARADLAWPAARVIVEYQGDHHRDRQQWRADLRRRSALEAAGWTVVETGWDDVLDPGPLVARLRTLLRRAR